MALIDSLQCTGLYSFMENLENEIWKPVVGWEELYEVSNTGKVKTKDRVVKCNTGEGIKKAKEMKSKTDRYGYSGITLRIGKRILQTGVHRLVAKAFIPNPEDKEQVNHIDGNKLNNHVTNLEWVNNKENSAHAVRTGLTNGKWELGENNPAVKLDTATVLKIRSMYAEGISQIAISKQLDICSRNTHCIVRRKSWKHI